MKILITGASGFVGSFLVEQALERGFEVWAAVRPSSSRQYLTDSRIRFIELNIEQEDQLRHQLSAHREAEGGFDHVIHAAAATKAKDEAAFRRANTDGTRHLAQQLLALNMLRGRFVFVSSLSVMGALHENAQTDAQGKPLRGAERYRPFCETDQPQPNTAYGRSKLEAEKALAQLPELNYVTLRPTGVYGPRERDYFLMADSIRKHLDFAVGRTPQVITFVYVRDLVEACFLALERGTRGKAYLISDGCDYNSQDFSQLLKAEMQAGFVFQLTAPVWVLRAACFVSERISRLSGQLSALNMDKFQLLRQRNWRCDISPARQELGYAPRWTLREGVREAVAWYRQAGWL